MANAVEIRNENCYVGMVMWLCVLIDVFGYVYELWMVWILGKV
jgi:hypothetical protein